MPEPLTPEDTLRGRRRLLPWLLLMAVAVTGFGLQRWLSPDPVSIEPPESRPLVAVADYERTSKPLQIRRLGRIHARHESRVAAEIAGRVMAVHPELRPGGRVAAGAELVELDTRALNLRRAELAAERRARSAEREQLALRLRRLEDLARREFVSGDQLDEQRARLTAAEAAVERLDAQLGAVALDLERSVVRAPFAADVLTVNVAPGDIAQPGLTLAQLVSALEQEVRLGLTQAELPMLESAWRRQGLAAEIAGSEGRMVPLLAPRLAANVEEGSRTVLLAFDVPVDETLRRNERVDVVLALAADSAYYRLPRSALQRERSRVWRLTGEDTLVAATVTPLLFDDDFVYVTSDELGDSGAVLTTSLPTVTEGMAVQVRNRAGNSR